MGSPRLTKGQSILLYVRLSVSCNLQSGIGDEDGKVQ